MHRSADPISRASSRTVAGGDVGDRFDDAPGATAGPRRSRRRSRRSGCWMKSTSSRPCALDLREQPEEQRTVGARTDRDLQIVVLHPATEPRVDGDHPCAALAGLVDRGRQHHRVGVGQVGPDHDDHVGVDRARRAASSPGPCRTPSCWRCRPTPCRSGRCSRCAGCRARGGRTCPSGRPSRWSANRPTGRRWRRRRAARGSAGTRRRRGRAPPPNRPRRARRHDARAASAAGRDAAPVPTPSTPSSTPRRR